MELQTRARFLARVISVLYAKRGLRGKLVTANRGARFLSLGIRLSDPLTLDAALGLAESLALAVNCPAVIAQRRKEAAGLVTYQFELQAGYWISYTRQDVTGLGVGLGESKRQIDFCFEPPHCLVAGTTDSGKSETVRSVLCGLLTSFTPDALGLVLVDPHRDFDDLRNAAHLSYPVASDADDIDQALSYAGQELARRKETNDRNARRLVVVIDEAQDALEGERLAIAQRIAGEARKFRIHLIVSTQKPQQKNLPDLVDKCNNRFVGLVDNAHTSAMLTGQSGLSCHLLTGRGDFVHVAGAAVERLQVALATAADLEAIPRAEIERPEVEPADTPRVLNFPEPKSQSQGGRPPTEIEPRKVAYYVHYLAHGHDITISQARDTLGLARYAHYKHRDFARETADELKRLYAAMKGATA